MPATNVLLAYIFDEPTGWYATEVGGWMETSPRFRAFVETYRDKIRKKSRLVRDEANRRDLQCELETAYLLSQHRSFAVEYERYGMGKRGPDLSITYKTHTLFNVEVKRLRPATTLSPDNRSTRLIDTVCEKLRQLPPRVINVLAISVEHGDFALDDLETAMRVLKERAERGDELWLKRQGYLRGKDFFKDFYQLSGILLRIGASDAAGASGTLWLNKGARHSLPKEISTILRSQWS